MSLEGLPRHTRTVGLSELVERVVHASYTDLRRLATNLPGQPEADRKRELARYLHNLRQRLTRLHVLAEWAPKNRGAQIAVKCGDMMGQLRQHQMAFTDAADRLYGLRQQMDWAAGPLYDTPGALDVLCNGRYSNLPKAIADVAPKPVPLETDPELIELRDERCRRFDVEIRGLLVDERNRKTMPKAMRVFSVRDGECVVGVPGEYRATLTLGGPPPLPPPPEEDEDGAENEPNPKKDSDPAPPPSRLGGWLVVKIEMLAGEMMDADEEEGRAAHTRVFPLTKTEVKILGERATARMAGMSPPPPAPPELVEGGAQGLGGLHYVCHDIALRLCALTVMNQSKKVARGGGAWHGGAIRTEQIMGKAEARAGIDEDAGEPGETEDGEQEHKKPARGAGEGIRMWFWLPGLAAGEGLKASTGNRMAGVDVGSVEVGVGNAAAVDAAVAAGTLPRVELTYERADDKDSSSGAIAARALIPTDRAGVVEIETFDLPFSTASVDIKEVLADGVRAAAATRLRAALTDLEPACQAAGIDVPTLALDAVNTGDANEDGWMAHQAPRDHAASHPRGYLRAGDVREERGRAVRLRRRIVRILRRRRTRRALGQRRRDPRAAQGAPDAEAAGDGVGPARGVRFGRGSHAPGAALDEGVGRRRRARGVGARAPRIRQPIRGVVRLGGGWRTNRRNIRAEEVPEKGREEAGGRGSQRGFRGARREAGAGERVAAAPGVGSRRRRRRAARDGRRHPAGRQEAQIRRDRRLPV